MPITLSLPEARRLAVAAQGFGPKPATPDVGHLRKLAALVRAFQIDSVTVLARAHYVPAFARLGPYPMDALDVLAYRTRELFESWGHAACLLPVSLYPLLRYRMHAEQTQVYMQSERGASMAKVYAEVAERGPISAAELSDPGQRSRQWWGWGRGKATLEHLYDSGLVAIAGRRGFERLYDIAVRVIPQAALAFAVPHFVASGSRHGSAVPCTLGRYSSSQTCEGDRRCCHHMRKYWGLSRRWRRRGARRCMTRARSSSARCGTARRCA